MLVRALVPALLLGSAASAAAQWDRPPEAGGRIASLGQPQRVHWKVGIAGGPVLGEPSAALALRAHLGVARDLLSPVIGVASVGVELYAGARNADADGGARVLFRIPYFSLGTGADYNVRDNRLDLVVTAHSPIRRGGIILRGGQLRADWYPTRAHSFTLGLSFPVGDPLIGRGRPLRDYVVVSGDFQPDVPYDVCDSAAIAVLDSLRVSAEWIRRFVAPYMDHDGRRANIAEQRTARSLEDMRDRLAVRGVEEEVRFFHHGMDRAFGIAAGNDTVGATLGQRARAVLLQEVILPYNGLLGMKKRHDALRDLNTVARGRFSRWLVASHVVSADRTDHVLYVFQALTGILEDLRETASREWDDPRLVWLPLQYALLPEDHDEQAELDALLERATGVAFSTRNRVRYVANLQFHWELLRMIRETQDYHVLWIHDFPAVTGSELDWASLSQVVDGYLTTLAERVEAYDATGHLPVFFIFHDQHYYEGRGGRFLMNVLEDPLGTWPQLPQGITGDLAPLRRIQHRLRQAVRNSRVLQAEARQYGDAWLRNRIKVHVSITNRPDASFWSGSLVATLFGYPDNIMRDHRKIAFRDVSETDPFAGVAIITGMGVGSQYLGPSWEDRSLKVQGPALLTLRQAARDLLLTQGLPAEAMPMPLRVAPGALTEHSPDDEFRTPALLLVNGTGYLPKPLNVGKALLYSLATRGSVLKIPDSLWNSTFFAGLLVGACLRGAMVSIVAPGADNAPSAGFLQMARAHELFTRLLMVRSTLAEPMSATGGALHAGLYAVPADTRGLASRTEQWVRQVEEESAGVRDLMPFRTDLASAVAAADVGGRWTNRAEHAPGRPRLHMKVQFFATAALWHGILDSPVWPEFIATYLRYRQATYVVGDGPGDTDGLVEELNDLATRIFDEVSTVPGAASYASVGSQNQDYRGMFMDGEIGMFYAGSASLVPLLDLAFLEGTVTWIEDQATLEQLLPPVGELGRRFARVSKDAM